LYCKEKSFWKKLKRFNNCLSPVEFTEGMVDHENSGQVFMSSRFIFSPINDFEDARISGQRFKTRLRQLGMKWLHK
jgi:hypothetical protein